MEEREDRWMEEKTADMQENRLTATTGVEAMKAKYGTIYEMELSLEPDDNTRLQFTYYFRRPVTASYDRYVKTVAKSSTKANRAFIMDNIVDEQRDTLMQTLDQYPAMTFAMSEKLLNMLGLSEANLTKL